MAQSAEDILKTYVANLVFENAVLQSRVQALNEQVTALTEPKRESESPKGLHEIRKA